MPAGFGADIKQGVWRGSYELWSLGFAGEPVRKKEGCNWCSVVALGWRLRGDDFWTFLPLQIVYLLIKGIK